MDQSVMEDESMMGAQAAPVALSQEKKVCGTCGSEFTKQSNLNRHKETKHTDQSTPEAVAKRFKLNEYRKNTRCERRANDPVYREKEKQISQTNRMNKKACQVAEDGGHTGGVSNDVKAKDESISVEAEADKKDGVEKKGDGMWIPTDVVRTLHPTANVISFFTAPAPLPVTVAGSGGGGGANEAEKKAPTEKNGRWVWVEGDVADTLEPPSTASASATVAGGGGGGGADAPVRVGVAVVAPPPAAVMVPFKRKRPVTVLPTLEDMMRWGRE
jgi:hypothetical protein